MSKLEPPREELIPGSIGGEELSFVAVAALLLAGPMLALPPGISADRKEQVDLRRTADYVIEQPSSTRIMGTANVILETNRGIDVVDVEVV